jgi:hypothetical protein
VDPLNVMFWKRWTRSTKCLYQRKGLSLRIPKKKLQLSWSSCPHLSLALLTWLMDQGGEWYRIKNDFHPRQKKAEERLWKLIIVAEEPEDITAVDDEMYKELSAQFCKADARGMCRKRKVCVKFVWSLREFCVKFAWGLREVRLIVSMSSDEGSTQINGSSSFKVVLSYKMSLLILPPKVLSEHCINTL